MAEKPGYEDGWSKAPALRKSGPVSLRGEWGLHFSGAASDICKALTASSRLRSVVILCEAFVIHERSESRSFLSWFVHWNPSEQQAHTF